MPLAAPSPAPLPGSSTSTTPERTTATNEACCPLSSSTSCGLNLTTGSTVASRPSCSAVKTRQKRAIEPPPLALVGSDCSSCRACASEAAAAPWRCIPTAPRAPDAASSPEAELARSNEPRRCRSNEARRCGAGLAAPFLLPLPPDVMRRSTPLLAPLAAPEWLRRCACACSCRCASISCATRTVRSSACILSSADVPPPALLARLSAEDVRIPESARSVSSSLATQMCASLPLSCAPTSASCSSSRWRSASYDMVATCAWPLPEPSPSFLTQRSSALRSPPWNMAISPKTAPGGSIASSSPRTTTPSWPVSTMPQKSQRSPSWKTALPYLSVRTSKNGAMVRSCCVLKPVHCSDCACSASSCLASSAAAGPAVRTRPVSSRYALLARFAFFSSFLCLRGEGEPPPRASVTRASDSSLSPNELSCSSVPAVRPPAIEPRDKRLAVRCFM